MSNHDSDHWLVRPRTIRLIWQVSIAILIALVALQLVIKVKGYFGVDGWVGFGAVFGFAACVTMVLVAKALGLVLKRDENYYAEGERDD
jgi:sterol desaturase/sphingolipid hydroxylase (fatty acid hydroxylase superfamily)